MKRVKTMLNSKNHVDSNDSSANKGTAEDRGHVRLMEDHKNPNGTEARLQATAKTEENLYHGNPPFPELRLVLLGRKDTGKSSVGNTIIGPPAAFESGKPTEECVKRRADVAGRRVTVVDTPGWEWYYSGNGTPGWVRRETIRSVSLCQPGPHTLLLVVRSSASVTADYYQQIEEHLELLGKAVWDHTVVLFTRGDELGSVPIEQRIRNGGQPFQKLLERCGNRFHVLENKRRGDDGSQVKELLKKIEELVEERGGRYYESDPFLLMLDIEGRRRARERRKKQRLMEAQTQRGIIKTVLTADVSQIDDLDEKNLFSRGSRRLPELRLILLGERETGKSSAGNTILRGATHFQTGEATEECSRKQAEVSGRLVTVVDVPGWEGGPEGITPERVRREIGVSVTLCPPGPHALLLTLRVDALVTATAVKEHLELLGEGVWKHTILLFTRGDQLREGVNIEQHIQGGGRDLHWLMEKCGNRYHVLSSLCLEDNSSTVQVTGLLEKIEKMVAGNRCEAFSPLMQEIQELGKQKNEKFSQKLKEVNEKLQRQETELKRLREREVKSIRWFFDRRRDKGKSAEKTFAEKEEASDRGEDDRRSITSELEERMTWLTEDQEREIQQLSVENNRIIAALKQIYSERDKLIMKLEEKERETEEKVDELQVKVLELERVCRLKEQERKAKEGELRTEAENAGKEIMMLKQELDHQEKKGEELQGKFEEARKMMADSNLEYEAEILQGKQEIERHLREKKVFEQRLDDKQKEVDEFKMKADNKEKEQEERLKEMNEKWDREKNKLREIVELMTKEMEGLQAAYQEQVKILEAERHMHEITVGKYSELVEKLVGKDAEMIAMEQRQREREISMNGETQKILQEKVAEITALAKKHMEREQEIQELKQTTDFTQRIMENVKNNSQAKIEEFTSRIKLLEDESKEMEEFLKRENVILKEEIDIIKNLHEVNTRKKDDETRQIIEVKESLIGHLHRQNEDRETLIKDLNKQLGEREIREDSLQNLNATLVQELEELQLKCEEFNRELQDERDRNQSREKEIKDVLNQYEQMGKLKDALSQEHIEKKENEICLLKQTNNMLHTDMEVMKERGVVLEKNIDEMKKYYEGRLLERTAKMNAEDLEREQALHGRELELHEQEQALKQALQELERHKKDLEKRGDIINEKEQGLREEEQELNLREREVRDTENRLEYQCKDNESCREDLQKRSLELEKREIEVINGEQKLEQQMKIKYEELEAAEKNRYEKQEKEIQKIRQQLDERESEQRKTQEELVIKQLDIKELVKNLENCRENLDMREIELNKREQTLVDSEQIYENQNQELSKAMQKMEKTNKHNDSWHAELTNKENIFMQKLNEFQKKEHAIELREKELMNTQNELQKRKQKLTEREKYLDEKEHQITQKCEECEAAGKILENKQKEHVDWTEKKEKEIENIRQQVEKRENELRRMEEELVVMQQNFRQEVKDLENQRENLEMGETELNKREKSTMDLEQIYDQQKQELSTAVQELEKNTQHNDKWQTELTKKEYDLVQRLNEFQKKEHAIELREQELMNTQNELQKRKQKLTAREKYLDEKEHQITQKCEECEAAGKILENKQKEHVDWTEKKEKEMENIRQQVEKRENELRKMEEELVVMQQNFRQEVKDLENQRENLEMRETELNKREKSTMDLEQIHDQQKQEPSTAGQELEKNAQHNDKWQTELTKKNQETESYRQQFLCKQQNQANLGDVKQDLAVREQEVAKKEDELQKREQDLKSAEISLERREEIVQKREGEVQIDKQQLDSILSDFKRKQKELEEIVCFSEAKQHQFTHLEKGLVDREIIIANQEHHLKNRYKELDIKEHNIETHELDLKSRENTFEQREQELYELKKEVESKNNDLENLRNDLENEKQELNNEKQIQKMKIEELEKWEKYLYNSELEIINHNPNSDFQPWGQTTASNGNQAKATESPKMYQEGGVDGKTCEGEGNSNKTEWVNNQSVEVTSSSQTTNHGFENTRLTGKGALETKTEDEVNQANWLVQKAEEEEEEFFEPTSSAYPLAQSLLSLVSELRIVLLGESWSTRHSATYTILGQDAGPGNPWKGSVCGKPLMVVEPHGIKWRSSRDADVAFQMELFKNVSLCTPGPHAFILLLPAYLTFTAQYRKAVEHTMTILGEAAWRHTIVLFTWGEALGESGQQHIKRNGDLEWLVKKCGGRYHVLDNRHREAHVMELLEKVDKIAGNHRAYYHAQSC